MEPDVRTNQEKHRETYTETVLFYGLNTMAAGEARDLVLTLNPGDEIVDVAIRFYGGAVPATDSRVEQGNWFDDTYIPDPGGASDGDELTWDASGSEWVATVPVIPDHGTLSGLTDDDHIHYSLVDGTRAFTGDVSIGVDGGVARSFFVHGPTLGDYGCISTGPNRFDIDAFGSNLYISADSSIFFRPTGRSTTYATFTSSLATFATDVSIGEDGAGAKYITIFGANTGVYSYLATLGSSTYLVAVGGTMWLVAGTDIVLDPTGSDVKIGADGAGNKSLKIHSSAAGDYLRAYTSGSNCYLQAVGGGSLYMVTASGWLGISAAGNVAVGVAGAGTRQFTVYSGVIGDHAQIRSGGNYTVLDAVGGSLYLDADSDGIYLRPYGGSTISAKFASADASFYTDVGIGDGAIDANLAIHSGTSGVYGQVRTGASSVIFDAVGTNLYLDADSNIYLRPTGGSAISATFTSSLATFTTGVNIGVNGSLALHTVNIYGGVASTQLQFRKSASTYSIIDAVGGSLYLDADSGIYLRPNGGSTTYATFTSSLATFATDVSIGTDGTGGDDLYIYGSVLGDYLHAYTSGSNSFLDAVGGVLYLGADSTVHISGDLGCIIGSSTDVVQLKVQASIAQSAHLTSWVDGLAATKSWADSAGILKTATNPTTDDALVRRGYLGTSATKDTGAGSGDVATGDHTHTGLYAPLAAPALTGAATLDGDALATEVYVDGTVQTASSSPVTVVVSDKLITADATSGSITVNLPAAASAVRTVTVAKVDSGFNLVTIDPNASETIDGSTTLTLSSQWASSTLISDGSNWFTA